MNDIIPQSSIPMHKILRIITDNGSNIVLAFKNCETQEGELQRSMGKENSEGLLTDSESDRELEDANPAGITQSS